MTINEKVDLIIRFILENDLKEIEKLENRLRVCIGDNIEPTSACGVDDVIYNVLSEIGVPEHIKGHKYLAFAIKKVVQEPDIIDNMTGKFYPTIGRELDAHPKAIDRGIRHAIEIVFSRCDSKTLKKYFGNTINPESGQLKNGEFVARIANVVRRWG
jgi:hypothetical protein